MTLTTTVLLVLALYVARLFLQQPSLYRFSLLAIVGNRDTRPPMSVVAGRRGGAKPSMPEALAPFAPPAPWRWSAASGLRPRPGR